MSRAALASLRSRLGARLPSLAAGLSLLAPLAAGQVPFPADEDSRLEELGTAFTVTGRVPIPRHVSIEAMRALTIQGQGEEATLEVSGQLKLRAATGGAIEFKDVWLELTPDCKQINLANCSFKGRGGIRPSPLGASTAKIDFEAVESDRTAAITIEAANGSLLMDRCFLDGPLVLRGIARSESVKSNFTVAIYGSSGKDESQRVRGLLGGVTLEGLKDATVRTCDLSGPLLLFADNRKLFLDGDNLRAERTEFRSSGTVGFGGVKITKTDFRSKKLVLASPPRAGKSERLTFESCYFRGMEDLETLRKEMLVDAENSESNVAAVLKDVRSDPHGLAGLEN